MIFTLNNFSGLLLCSSLGKNWGCGTIVWEIFLKPSAFTMCCMQQIGHFFNLYFFCFWAGLFKWPTFQWIQNLVVCFSLSLNGYRAKNINILCYFFLDTQYISTYNQLRFNASRDATCNDSLNYKNKSSNHIMWWRLRW